MGRRKVDRSPEGRPKVEAQLDAELYARLEAFRRARKITRAQVARNAIELYLGVADGYGQAFDTVLREFVHHVAVRLISQLGQRTLGDFLRESLQKPESRQLTMFRDPE